MKTNTEKIPGTCNEHICIFVVIKIH